MTHPEEQPHKTGIRRTVKYILVLLPIMLLGAGTSIIKHRTMVTPEDSLKMAKDAEESAMQLEGGLDGTPQGWNRIMQAAKRLYDLGEFATPILLKVASSKKANPIARKMAIEIVRDIGDVHAIGPLVKIARDTANPEGVRYDALSSLGRIATSEIVDTLLLFIGSDDILLKKAALTGVRSCNSAVDISPAFPMIIEIVKTGTDVGLRESATLALSAFGDDAVPLLSELLKDAEKRVRCRATYALAGTRSSAAVIPLVGLLSDSSQEVRTDAITALQNLGDTTAVPALVRMLSRGGYDASDAAFALMWMGDERALGPLRKAAQKSEAEGRDPGHFLQAHEAIERRRESKDLH